MLHSFQSELRNFVPLFLFDTWSFEPSLRMRVEEESQFPGMENEVDFGGKKNLGFRISTKLWKRKLRCRPRFEPATSRSTFTPMTKFCSLLIPKQRSYFCKPGGAAWISLPTTLCCGEIWTHIELHQTGTFEGHSTPWATAPWLLWHSCWAV